MILCGSYKEDYLNPSNAMATPTVVLKADHITKFLRNEQDIYAAFYGKKFELDESPKQNFSSDDIVHTHTVIHGQNTTGIKPDHKGNKLIAIVHMCDKDINSTDLCSHERHQRLNASFKKDEVLSVRCSNENRYCHAFRRQNDREVYLVNDRSLFVEYK